MKQFFLAAVLLCVFFSCKKESQRPDDVPDPNDTTVVPPPPPPPPPTYTDSTKFYLLATRETGSLGTDEIDLTCYNRDNSVKWKRTRIGKDWDYENYSTPTPQYYNGVVYYWVDSIDASFNTHGSFHAIDINTGNDIWSKPYSQEFMRNPVVSNNVLYCGYEKNNINHVAAFDPANGNLLWMTPIPESFGADNLLIEGNTLYFMSTQSGLTSYLNSFNLTSRTINWKMPIGGNVNGKYSVININNDVLSFTNGTGSLMAFNKNTGASLWTKASYKELFTFNNLLYAFDVNGDFHALTPSTGNAVHSWPGEHKWSGGNCYIGGTLLSDQTIYSLGIDSVANVFIQTFNPTTGSKVWRKNIFAYNEMHRIVGSRIYTIQQQTASKYIKIFDSYTGIVKDSILTNASGIGRIAVLTVNGKYLAD